MNINKYQGFFHDGRIFKFTHEKDGIIISMKSAQIEAGWNIDKVPLAADSTIRGQLHVKGIKQLLVNHKAIHAEIMEPPNDMLGEIMDLEIDNHTHLELLILWSGESGEDSVSQFIEAEAENIYWENIPDLSNQDWT